MRPREIELKYRVSDRRTADGLLRLADIGPFRADGPVRTARTLDRFFDTDDADFAARRYAFRLRQVDGAIIATVKGPSSRGPAGAVSRLELEVAVDGENPDTWPASPARDLATAIARGRPVHEIARIAQLRRYRPLRAPSAVVELSVDDVEVRDGDRTVGRWIELEAELHEGDPLVLDALGRALVAHGGLEPSPQSKLAAALRILHRPRARVIEP
ncbi:MAG TPA: CYTH domain-containing protein [Candidatus Limnocylindrales bacterium]|nr:CYTH domain-containing protein [Candidatus Limnocylindrales bacterium]